jgi:predicted DNA-binding transcriptional regulator AlpA
MTAQLVGTGEIAELLGISRQRVDQLATDSRSGFPAPVEVIRRGLGHRRLWNLAAVTKWAKETGRLPL